MNLRKFAEPYRKALCAYEAFSLFGFRVEHVTLICQRREITSTWSSGEFRAGELAVHIGLRASRGGTDFDMWCGPVHEDFTAATAMWSEAVTAWAEADRADLEHVWGECSLAGDGLDQLATALRAKGFLLPARRKRRALETRGRRLS